MSKKNRRIFLTLLTLFVVTLCVFAATHTPEFLVSQFMRVGTPLPPDPLEARLNNLASRYKNGEISVIDISTVTTFSWDRLHIFGDYTGSSDLDAVVGRSWRNSCNSQLSLVTYSDGFTLLVFSDNGTVVHCLAYPKDPYDLFVSNQGDKSGYSPEEALFVLDDQGRMVLKDNK